MIITYKNKPEVVERYYKNYYEYLHFSADENKRLDEINQNFVFMQNYLKDRMLLMANIFNELSQKDFQYLRDYRITGTINTFKPDPRCFAGFSGTLSPEQIKMYDKWNDFRFSNVWQLEYDSGIKDFTPLSKLLLSSSNFDYWRHTTFDICSYLSFLINQNENVTYKDLMDFDFSNDGFFTDIKVYINYTRESIFSYAESEQLQQERKILSERSHIYNESFNWSKSNIEHFFELDRFCKKKYLYMKKELKRLRQKLNRKHTINHFNIHARLHYNSKKETPTADQSILEMFARQLSCDIEEYIEIDEYKSVIRRPLLDDISLNWNYEEYSKFLNNQQRAHKFNPYMRRDLLDNDIFSFEDILNMKEDDFCICWQFRFYETISSFFPGED